MQHMENTFFNVHLCHICKNRESFRYSKLCSGCMLISYCSKEHQKIDWKNHKPICKAVQKLCKDTGVDIFNCAIFHLFVFHVPTLHMLRSTGMCSKSAWNLVRENATRLLEKQLERHLDFLEMQMVYHAKSCAVCFMRGDLKKESVCTNCYGVIYCAKHLTSQHNHKEVCLDLQKALDMGLFLLNIDLGPPEVPLIKPAQAIKLKLDTCDMQNFIAKYIKRGLKFEDETLFSFYYTNVLTSAYIINCIPKFTLGGQLIIHVVGASDDELTVVEYWENLLHLFPEVYNLRIIHIGPDVKDFRFNLSLCNGCSSANRSIDLLFHGQLYHEYCNSSCVMKPDVIMAFNSGLFANDPRTGYDSWGPTLPLFFRYHGVPFISTAWLNSEAEKDLKRLLSRDVIGNKKVNVVVNCEKNPFNNLRHWRCLEDLESPVLIKNRYVSALIVN